MTINSEDIDAILLTLRLALVVTAILLLIALPLAHWLSRTSSFLKAPINALVALPLVLPPTVLGFYALMLMGPSGPIGYVTETLGLGLLPFTFWGLVLGSCLYSLPFVVQPLQASMASLGQRHTEVAATLGAGPLDRFFSVTVPLVRPGLITAIVLGFAHTLGEFGVVLMIGGNIPGETRVVSVQIYDYVELLDYRRAHVLSAMMLIFSFLLLLGLYTSGRVKSIKLW